ncbi:MAG: rod shape-determining protein RodA [Actinomycetota bacterium]
MASRTIPTSVVLSDRRARLLSTPLRHLDVVLMGATLSLAGLGLVMVSSATKALTREEGVSSLYYVNRQAIWIVVGLLVMATVMAIDYRKLRDLAPIGYLGMLFLLGAVLLPGVGTIAKGSQARFQLGAFQLQPSEFMKFFLILMLAAYCYLHRNDFGFRRVVVAIVICGLPLALVMLQPDLGTALVLGAISFAMLTIGGVKGRYLAILALIVVTGAIGAVNLGVLKEYQVDRLTSFLDQDADTRDTRGTTFNLDQSKIAIANGGLTGEGLGEGTQTNGRFVPEQHTDFIFTAVGEELGFVGAATLLALFAIVVWRTWRTARLSNDFFGTLVCVGVIAMFTFQIFENVGMTMGIMPITGIPLPFMSYGGSSTIVCFACVGLVANVHMRRFS